MPLDARRGLGDVTTLLEPGDPREEGCLQKRRERTARARRGGLGRGRGSAGEECPWWTAVFRLEGVEAYGEVFSVWRGEVRPGAGGVRGGRPGGSEAVGAIEAVVVGARGGVAGRRRRLRLPVPRGGVGGRRGDVVGAVVTVDRVIAGGAGVAGISGSGAVVELSSLDVLDKIVGDGSPGGCGGDVSCCPDGRGGRDGDVCRNPNRRGGRDGVTWGATKSS